VSSDCLVVLLQASQLNDALGVVGIEVSPPHALALGDFQNRLPEKLADIFHLSAARVGDQLGVGFIWIQARIHGQNELVILVGVDAHGLQLAGKSRAEVEAPVVVRIFRPNEPSHSWIEVVAFLQEEGTFGGGFFLKQTQED
jgi:hypothetical protein